MALITLAIITVSVIGAVSLYKLWRRRTRPCPFTLNDNAQIPLNKMMDIFCDPSRECHQCDKYRQIFNVYRGGY